MTGTPLDRLILGDNQFFGVNHMSEERARAGAMRFQDIEAIMAVLDAAQAEGVRSFMCTTHDRVAEICAIVRANPRSYAQFRFLPCMPYAHKYADAVTDLGYLGALRRFMPEDGLLSALVRGGRSLATRDVEGIITLLVDAEMKMFAGLPTPVIFLQNVVVDLLLGLQFKDAFRIFADHVRARYHAEPGFITMNLPLLLDQLTAQGVAAPIVCANINKIGFRMCGGLERYRTALATHDCRAIAMSVFASGAIPPREALDWIAGERHVEAIVFGASSRTNIRATVDLLAAADAREQAMAA